MYYIYETIKLYLFCEETDLRCPCLLSVSQIYKFFQDAVC